MAHFKCQVTGIDVFPTSDLSEREHFCLISFEKCGERGYFIHGEVQDEFVIRFKLPPTAVDFLGRVGPAASMASWLTLTDTSDSHDVRVRI